MITFPNFQALVDTRQPLAFNLSIFNESVPDESVFNVTMLDVSQAVDNLFRQIEGDGKSIRHDFKMENATPDEFQELSNTPQALALLEELEKLAKKGIDRNDFDQGDAAEIESLIRLLRKYHFDYEVDYVIRPIEKSIEEKTGFIQHIPRYGDYRVSDYV